MKVKFCAKCERLKPSKGFHNVGCGDCRRDIWRQNRGLDPILPENRGNHLIKTPRLDSRKKHHFIGEIDVDESKIEERSLEIFNLNTAKLARRKRHTHRLKMTREDISTLRQKLVDDQGGCAICQDKTGPFTLDHIHGSEEIRGALCRRCNLGIGGFKDSPDLLENAALYIRARRRKALDSILPRESFYSLGALRRMPNEHPACT